MAVDPDTLTRFTADAVVHEVLTTKDDQPVLTKPGWFRSTMKCGVTCDCPPEDLEPEALRFTSGVETVTCLGCLV